MVEIYDNHSNDYRSNPEYILSFQSQLNDIDIT